MRIIKASRVLQARIGQGPLDEAAVRRCQDVMDSQKFDFIPLASQYLQGLGGSIEMARAQGLESAEALMSVTVPVMQLKANGAVFGFTLVTRLADVVLSFLEKLEALDQDAMSIVEALHEALETIVAARLDGDGGAHGLQFEQELQAACQRYLAKRS